MNWFLIPTEKLTSLQMLDILRIRSEVFVVEQECVYVDPDKFDGEAYHLIALDGELIVAYARILKPGTRFPEASIGRVLTVSSHRGQGLGKELMKKAIAEAHILYNAMSIRISAQVYLQKFYTELGFDACSEEYDEDGIPHVQMMFRIQ